MSKIFVHGLGQTDSSWNEVVNELEDTNCPNLKELLGLKEVTFDNLYEVFCEYCNNFSDKIDLCGISLGGMAVILKNNKPKYILVDFEEYEDIQRLKKERENKILETADKIIDDNLEASD